MSLVNSALNVSFENLKECISWLNEARQYAYDSRDIDHDTRELMQDLYYELSSVRGTLFTLLRDVK